jgi:hypothetical protein
MDNETGTKVITSEELTNMSMQEWAKIRGQLIGGNNANTNRGMYS